MPGCQHSQVPVVEDPLGRTSCLTTGLRAVSTPARGAELGAHIGLVADAARSAVKYRISPGLFRSTSRHRNTGSTVGAVSRTDPRAGGTVGEQGSIVRPEKCGVPSLDATGHSVISDSIVGAPERAGRQQNWVEREYYRAHVDMTDDDVRFCDFLFKLLNIADAAGIFYPYFADKGPESVSDTLVMGGTETEGFGRNYGAIGATPLVRDWVINYYHYVNAFNGVHKPKVELVRNLNSFGGAVAGMGWRGKIQFHEAYFRCCRDAFFGVRAPAVPQAGSESAHRICAAMDTAGILVHELLHYCGDWREGPPESLEGWFRFNLYNLIQTNWLVEFFVLAAAGETSRPNSWVVSECRQRSWPCGVTWNPDNQGTCGRNQLRDDTREWGTTVTGCTWTG